MAPRVVVTAPVPPTHITTNVDVVEDVPLPLRERRGSMRYPVVPIAWRVCCGVVVAEAIRSSGSQFSLISGGARVL